MERKSDLLDEVRDDCLHLLMAIAAMKRVGQYLGEAAGSGTRQDMHLLNVAMREMENALVVRVCRFDDDGRNQVGLRSALASVRSLMSDAEIKSLNEGIKKFRAEVNPLKVRVRNQLVAHLSKGAQQPHDSTAVAIRVKGEVADIERVHACAGIVIELVDQMNGAPVLYGLKSGSAEPRVDLRQLTGVGPI